jgi:hypothetical protein
MSKRVFTFGTNRQRIVRKSHVIPRFYLAKFTNPKGQLWVYAKDRAPRVSIPEREAVERDFYECSPINNSKGKNVEEWFSRVESSASGVMAKVAEACPLQAEEMSAWAIFVSLLFLRTRKVRQQMAETSFKAISSKLRAPEYLRELQHELFQRGQFLFIESVQERAEKVIAQIEADAAFLHLAAFEGSGLHLAKSLAQKNWHTLHAPPGTSFLTSDCPVLTAKIDGQGQAQLGYGFDVENVAIMLPIAPEKLFVASPPQFGWRKTLKPNGLLMANLSIVRFAHKNVYAQTCNENIEKLVNLEIDHVVFGENAFVRSDID